MKTFSPGGFTLVELMIVIAIIGILATALFPNLGKYFERSHDVEYQTIAKNWISLIEQYRIDHDGVIDSQQISNPETYCISNNADSCIIPYRHIGLSNYFVSNSDGLKALADKAKMPSFTSLSTGTLYITKATPAYFSTNGSLIFPGIDPTGTVKIETLSWVLPGNSGEPSGGNIRIAGSSLGSLPDKRCAPGIAITIRNNLSPTRTICMYIFK